MSESAGAAMIQWLEQYVRDLVREPDQVIVSTKEGVMVTQVQVKVASADLDLLDGRHNRLARALNMVLGLTGVRERRRYVFKVVD